MNRFVIAEPKLCIGCYLRSRLRERASGSRLASSSAFGRNADTARYDAGPVPALRGCAVRQGLSGRSDHRGRRNDTIK